MVKIRLARFGRKKAPHYKIVVADARKPRDSGYVDSIGFFYPITRCAAERLRFDKDKYLAWIQKGAQPSSRVQSVYKEYCRLNTEN